MKCPVTAGERQHGSRQPTAGRRGEWSGPPLTGHADRSMLASRYEKTVT